MGRTMYIFRCCNPKRLGETLRKCERCGGDFDPKTRGQRYCPDCKHAHELERHREYRRERKERLTKAVSVDGE